MGNWTAANYNEKDMFILIEPLFAAWHEATERFKQCGNVVISNIALSEKNSIANFYENGCVSTMSKKWIKKSRHDEAYCNPIKTCTETLDCMICLYGIPDLVKIDVEGYEYNVLKGLTQKVGQISFEYCEELVDEAIKCVKYLKSLGYDKFHCQHGDEYTYRPDSWLTYRKMLKYLRTDFVPERKQRWGMIHAS